MRRVFKDDKQQKQFEDEGYVLVDLFNEKEISELEKIYSSYKVMEQPGIEISVWNGDYDVNKAICDQSGAIMNNKLKDIIQDYDMLYCGFVTKKPGKPGVSQLHQDPTFVDETQYRAINIWSPLVDTDENNGALHIIKRSHKMYRGYRGYTVFEYNYADIREEVISRFSTIVKMKAGQAIIIDPALMHHSYDNKTDTQRIVCTGLMVPKEVPPIHYHHNKKLNSLDVVEIDNKFLLTYFSKYLGAEELDRPLVKRMPFAEPVNVTLDDFEQRYLSVNSKPQLSNKINGIFKKIFSFS